MMRSRIRCWLTGHQYPDWPAWTHGGRGKFYRQRYCRRCHRQQTELDQ